MIQESPLFHIFRESCTNSPAEFSTWPSAIMKKLYERFWQIISEIDPSVDVEGMEKILSQSGKTLQEGGRDRLLQWGVRSWRFDSAEYKIIVVRDRSVYSGDLDHRH